MLPTNEDVYLFHEGSHFFSYRFFGAHTCEEKGMTAVRFNLWAPNAVGVQVTGDFNHWDGFPMERINDAGIWTAFVPGVKVGSLYKYRIETEENRVVDKADPYAFFSEEGSGRASVVYPITGYQWGDKNWQGERKNHPPYHMPLNIYEVHLGSWMRKTGKFLSYRELAGKLVDYAKEMGYTHIELMPVAEHPYYGSWGYQATGYYSVTNRYGTPHDFMYFVDRCHQNGIGVILDWVPGHFCPDSHGLACFDGTFLYEYPDIERRQNQDWGTLNFDLGKPEIRSFLISNAVFWLHEYHVDGIRVDAVASMLYLDYGKKPGQWRPNIKGGKENLEAVAFMQKLNEVVFAYFPGVLMIAEESTDWPLVSRPTFLGGLGYNYKWNMGWMNDMLRYIGTDFPLRKNVHNLITFSLVYAFSENFILPLSHDEVVHGKKSLLDKMPGDYWQKFAGLRVFYSFMMAHPGKKLLFMGGEFGQFVEWRHDQNLDWNLLEYEMHDKLKEFVQHLNWFYQKERCLWEVDHSEEGFRWISADDNLNSVVSFIRKGKNPQDFLVVACNFSPSGWEVFRLGIPVPGAYREVFNSDQAEFGGTGRFKNSQLVTEPIAWQKQPYSLKLKIPPLAAVYLKLSRKKISQIKKP